MEEMPEYVIERVLRAAPRDAGVIGLSTPVVAFGNARTARVATLGLNPSRVEFLDREGNELAGGVRRLATRQSLGRLLEEPLHEVDGLRVVADCDCYFERNPYMRWFGDLESIVGAIGASYFGPAASACHLDVAQWATEPVWGKLRTDQRRRLVADGRTFLLKQLRAHRIELLLINGGGALQPVRDRVRHVRSTSLDGCTLTVGVISDVRVVAWSTNLQSSFGVSHDFRRRLREVVSTFASGT